jgi:hypothetical protein
MWQGEPIVAARVQKHCPSSGDSVIHHRAFLGPNTRQMILGERA